MTQRLHEEVDHFVVRALTRLHDEAPPNRVSFGWPGSLIFHRAQEIMQAEYTAAEQERSYFLRRKMGQRRSLVRASLIRLVKRGEAQVCAVVGPWEFRLKERT